MKYIAEVRRGYLMRYHIGTFDTREDAESAIKKFKKENPHYLGLNDFYEVNIL